MLAPALHNLPHLASLDLSTNYLHSASMRALAPALAQCATLIELNMASTIPLANPTCDSLAALAAAVAPLPRLATLSLSGIGAVPDSHPDTALSEAVAALLEALAALPCMRALDLELAQFKLAVGAVPRFAAALQRLSRLTRLNIAVPHLAVPITHSARAAQHTWAGERDVLGRAFAALTSLDALKLDTCGLTFARRQAVPAFAHLSELTGLRALSMHLRDGRLQSPEAPFQASVALRALLLMSALTELRCHCSTFAPRTASVAMLVHLVSSAMLQLRVLHLPVQAVAAGAEALVSTLLSATHVRSLSIDVYAAVNRSLDEGAYAEEIANVDFLSPYAPLFPYAHSLTVEIDDWNDQWLWRIAGGLAEFSELRRLSLCTTDIHQDGPVCEILLAVSRLTALQELTVDVAFVAGAAAAPPRWFCAGMSALGALTYLHCGVHCGRDVTALPQQVLLACPRLRKLYIGAYPAAEHAAYAAALAPLPLGTLVVGLVLPEHVGALAELLGSLTYLRSLRLHGELSAGDKDLIQGAAAESAACHDVRFEQA